MPVLQPLEAPASLQPVDQSGIPWIGPRPVGDISQLPGGKEYIALVKDNNKTQRGFIESVADIGLKDIPFAGPGLEAPKLFGLAETARKIHEGRPVADQALVNLNLYLQENQRKEKNTIGGDVADILKTVFTWGVEFASMRVPIGWVAKAGTAEASVSAKVAKKMVEKSVLQLLEDNLKSQAMKQAGKQLILGARSAAIKGVAASILDVPRTLETAGYLQVNNILNGGNWSDTQAVLAGILDSSIQFGAQYAGQSVFKPLFGGAQGLIGANTRAYMASRGAKAATVLGNRPTAKTMIGLAATIQSKLAANPFLHPEDAIDWLKNAGYGGVAEQIFAVQPLTGFLEGLTGLRGDQAGIVNALRTGIPDLKTLKAEALAFMIPGAIAATKVHVAGGKYGAAFDRQMRLLHSVDPRYSEKGDVTRTTEQIEKFGTDISAMFKGEKENPSLWSLVFGKDFTKPGSLKDTLRDVHTRIRWNALEEVYNRAEAKQAGTGYEAVKRQAMDFARGQYAEVATGAEAEAIQKRVVRLPGGVLVQRPPAEGESLLSGIGLLVGDEGAVNKVLQEAEKNRLNPTEFVADDHPDFAQKVEDFGHLLQIHDPAERIKMYRTVKAMLDSGEYPEGIYHIGPLFYDVGDPKDVNSVVASIVLGTHRDGKLYISPLRDAAQNLPSNTSTLIHEALESRTPLEQLDSDPVMRDVDAGIATEIRRLRQMFPEDRRLEELESWGGTREGRRERLMRYVTFNRMAIPDTRWGQTMNRIALDPALTAQFDATVRNRIGADVWDTATRSSEVVADLPKVERKPAPAPEPPARPTRGDLKVTSTAAPGFQREELEDRSIMLTGATSSHGFKELGKEAISRLLSLPRNTPIHVGDEPSGADRAFQDILKKENFTNVTVHTIMGTANRPQPRYNAGFSVQFTKPPFGVSFREKQRAKDQTMLNLSTDVLGAKDLGPSSREYVNRKPFGYYVAAAQNFREVEANRLQAEAAQLELEIPKPKARKNASVDVLGNPVYPPAEESPRITNRPQIDMEASRPGKMRREQEKTPEAAEALRQYQEWKKQRFPEQVEPVPPFQSGRTVDIAPQEALRGTFAASHLREIDTAPESAERIPTWEQLQKADALWLKEEQGETLSAEEGQYLLDLERGKLEWGSRRYTKKATKDRPVRTGKVITEPVVRFDGEEVSSKEAEAEQDVAEQEALLSGDEVVEAELQSSSDLPDVGNGTLVDPSGITRLKRNAPKIASEIRLAHFQKTGTILPMGDAIEMATHLIEKKSREVWEATRPSGVRARATERTVPPSDVVLAQRAEASVFTSEARPTYVAEFPEYVSETPAENMVAISPIGDLSSVHSVESIGKQVNAVTNKGNIILKVEKPYRGTSRVTDISKLEPGSPVLEGPLERMLSPESPDAAILVLDMHPASAEEPMNLQTLQMANLVLKGRVPSERLPVFRRKVDGKRIVEYHKDSIYRELDTLPTNRGRAGIWDRRQSVDEEAGPIKPLITIDAKLLEENDPEVIARLQRAISTWAARNRVQNLGIGHVGRIAGKTVVDPPWQATFTKLVSDALTHQFDPAGAPERGQAVDRARKRVQMAPQPAQPVLERPREGQLPRLSVAPREPQRPLLTPLAEIPASEEQIRIAGYKSRGAFEADYRKRARWDLAETQDEFARRRYCEGPGAMVLSKFQAALEARK